MIMMIARIKAAMQIISKREKGKGAVIKASALRINAANPELICSAKETDSLSAIYNITESINKTASAKRKGCFLICFFIFAPFSENISISPYKI